MSKEICVFKDLISQRKLKALIHNQKQHLTTNHIQHDGVKLEN